MNGHSSLPGLGVHLLDAAKALSHEAATLRGLPWPAAVLLIALGLGAMLFAARFRRAVAALGGAVCGFAAAHFFAAFITPLDLAPEVAGYGGAALLLLLCAAFPPLFLSLAGAIPGALAGEHLAIGGQGAWGMLLGAALGGAGGLFAARLLASCTAAAVGAGIVCAGLLALSGSASALALLAHRPFLLAGLWAALAISGATYQFQSAWGGGGGGGAKKKRRVRTSTGGRTAEEVG